MEQWIVENLGMTGFQFFALYVNPIAFVIAAWVFAFWLRPPRWLKRIFGK